MKQNHKPLLEVRNLKQYFPIQRGMLRKVVGYVRAVDDVSLDIYENETVGLVGESGCGKTTLGRALIRLYEPTGGDVYFNDGEERIDVLNLDPKEIRKLRSNMQMIFQDPFSSLNERMTVLGNIGEPLLVNDIAKGRELEDRVAEVVELVGLSKEHLRRYPHSFSGGQRQRIGIARALAIRPKFIVADEPVSALDVSIQAQILNLLKDLQEQLGLTYLFISHDISVVRYLSDRIAVMYVGRMVELAGRDELLNHPMHPYTEALLSAVPRTDLDHVYDRILMPDNMPDPSNLPPGCNFHPRCIYATELCKTEKPEFVELRENHFVSCHRAEELQLRGISTTKSAS
ncbi:MAG: ABC transporter ATP-binding protein [Firmicutes bacterium]|nr:ABC transporter ATP-binding protein [Bacillota bacterium]